MSTMRFVGELGIDLAGRRTLGSLAGHNLSNREACRRIGRGG